MITSLVPAARAVLALIDARPELPAPAAMIVRTTVSLKPEPVRLTLPSLFGGNHFGAIAVWARALGAEFVTVTRERNSVELSVTAELADGTPVRVAAEALFEPALTLVAALPLVLDEPVDVPVCDLLELADAASAAMAEQWSGPAGPIEQDLADELAQLPLVDEDQALDTAMLTVSADAVREAMETTAQLDMAAELAARDQAYAVELATASTSTSGGEPQ